MYIAERGRIKEHVRVYNDAGCCGVCGQKRKRSKRANVTVVAMTLYKGWRTAAYPHSYRVERLAYTNWSRGRPVWKEVQRIPRQRGTWDLQAAGSAVSAMERRFMLAYSANTHGVLDEPAPYRPMPTWPDWRGDTVRLLGIEWRNRFQYPAVNRFYRVKWWWQDKRQQLRARVQQ